MSADTDGLNFSSRPYRPDPKYCCERGVFGRGECTCGEHEIGIGSTLEVCDDNGEWHEVPAVEVPKAPMPRVEFTVVPDAQHAQFELRVGQEIMSEGLIFRIENWRREDSPGGVTWIIEAVQELPR